MQEPHDPIDVASLTESERLLLAEQLLDSVLNHQTSLTPEQLAEVCRRAAAIDRGEMALERWESVRAALLPPA